jgi:hypothetical protein
MRDVFGATWYDRSILDYRKWIDRSERCYENKMNQIVGSEKMNKMEKNQAKYMGVLRGPMS